MAPSETAADGRRAPRPEGAASYRAWAELLARTFAVDVLACPNCHGRMRLLAMVEDPAEVTRYLAAVGEATEVPPARRGAVPRTGSAACSAARRLVRRTTVRAAGCRRPRCRGVEDGGRARGRRSLRLELIEATRHPPVKGQ